MLSKVDALLDYDPLVLFKCLLIGQWHGLSDPKLERALKVREADAPIIDATLIESAARPRTHIDAMQDREEGEATEFGTMIEGATAQRVLADKAYASRANREALKARHRDGIMSKAARYRPLRQSEKRFNKLISKRHFRVEQCFGTMKRLFGLDRARYFGLAKTHVQLAMAAISQNLLKAANKITLQPQTSAIATS